MSNTINQFATKNKLISVLFSISNTAKHNPVYMTLNKFFEDTINHLQSPNSKKNSLLYQTLLWNYK